MTDEAADKKRRVRLERRPEAITYAVDDLLLAVRDGVVRVPHVQRGMRWDAGDRVALFDSLLRGFPIGTLLFWRRKGPEETLPLDGLELHWEARDEAFYVVDGQQRVCALVQTAFVAQGSQDRVLCLRLDAQSFEWERSERLGDAAHVPVRALLDTARLTDWIIDHRSTLTTESRASAIEASKRLREYRLSAWVIDAEDPDVVAEAFERLHRAGRRRSDAEVAFVARAEIGALRVDARASPRDWAADFAVPEHDERVALARVLHMVTSGEAPPSASGPVFGATAAWLARARRAVLVALGFLSGECAIQRECLSPDDPRIVAVARFFNAFPEPSRRTRTLLRRWVWRSLTGLRRAGTSASAASEEGIVHGSEDDTAQRLLALVPTAADPSIFDTAATDIRTARTKVQTCALVARTPRDLRTSVPVDVAAVAARDASPLVKVVGDDASNDLAACIFHAPLPRRELVRLLAQADEATLASHLIDAPALHALTSGDEEGFVSLRREALVSWLRTFTYRMAEWGADDSPPIASLAAEDDD